MTRARGVAALLLAAGALGLAGCDEDAVLRADAIEPTVAAQYADQNPGISLTTLACADAPAEVGAPLACTAVNDRGVQLEIEGEVLEVDLDEGSARYRVEVVRALAPGTLYSEAALPVLRRAGAPAARVTCPERIEVREGAIVDCEMFTANGRARAIRLVLTDRDGEFRIVGFRVPA